MIVKRIIESDRFVGISFSPQKLTKLCTFSINQRLAENKIIQLNTVEPIDLEEKKKFVRYMREFSIYVDVGYRHKDNIGKYLLKKVLKIIRNRNFNSLYDEFIRLHELELDDFFWAAIDSLIANRVYYQTITKQNDFVKDKLILKEKKRVKALLGNNRKHINYVDRSITAVENAFITEEEIWDIDYSIEKIELPTYYGFKKLEEIIDDLERKCLRLMISNQRVPIISFIRYYDLLTCAIRLSNLIGKQGIEIIEDKNDYEKFSDEINQYAEKDLEDLNYHSTTYLHNKILNILYYYGLKLEDLDWDIFF